VGTLEYENFYMYMSFIVQYVVQEIIANDVQKT